MNQLSKREEYAAMAMQGIFASPYTSADISSEEIAVCAVAASDALIAELERTAPVKESLTTDPDADGWKPHPHVTGGSMPRR